MEEPKKSEVVFFEKGKTDAVKIQESENITGEIDASLTLPGHTKTKAVTETAACATLKADIASQVALKADLKNLVKKIKEDRTKFSNARKRTARDVEDVLDGDGTAIGELGYETKIIGEKSPVGKCGKILSLILTQSLNSGGVDADWKRDAKARVYKIQWTTGVPEDPESWKDADNSEEPSESKLSITDQKTGSSLHVRVCGVNTAGHGPFSDVITITVP